jgi:hypothetical protein
MKANGENKKSERQYQAIMKWHGGMAYGGSVIKREEESGAGGKMK